ncbi:MAG TPA: hypothetical protein DCW42_02865 [Bacteroidetes bacterium]|nr:hypothetical protein [Bacteroidota bacterium]
MMKSIISKIPVLIAVIFFQSCDQENVTNPKNDNQIGNPMLAFINVDGQSAYIYSMMIRTIANTGEYSDSYQEYSYFYDESGHPLLAQSVTLNDISLNRPIDTKVIPFDGSSHIWNVIADSPLISYSDTINSINTFTITQPRSFIDTIHKSNAFNIQYTPIAEVDSVFIMLETDNFIAHYRVDSTINADSPDINKYIKIPNTGFYTVPSSLLASFPDKGILKISVVASRTKTKTINNKSFLVATLTACITYSVFYN